MKVRSSSLPYLMTCTNSVIHPEGWLAVEGENETALLGTLVHALCESVVATGEYDITPIRQQLSEADYDRAMMLFNNFLDVWRQAVKFMDAPEVEGFYQSDIGGVVITGHIDVNQRFTDRAYVMDYKTGRQHENHYHQMAAYAYLVWDAQGQPAAYTVHVTAMYLEDKTTQSYDFSADSLNKWAASVVEKIGDRRFVVGRKCSFCSVQGACTAYRQYIAGGLAPFTEYPLGQPQWETMPPEARGNTADWMYVVEKAIERAKFGLRLAVRKAGSLDLGGGQQYEMIEQTETGIDPAKASKVLAKLLPDWTDHAAFSLNTLLAAYAKRAPRGEKGKWKADLKAKLADAGAIITAKSHKMYRRPKAEQRLSED